MGVGQILRDFSGWTSAHGIPHIGSAQNLCLRLFWTVIFCASTAMFIFQMVLLVNKYLAYDVTVQTELKFEERFFPAVTICNLNPYKKNSIQHHTENINTLMADYKEAIVGRVDAEDKWKFQGLNDTIAIQSRARDQLMFLASKWHRDNQATLDKIAYSKKEFIMNCAYNTEQCDLDNDFVKTVDPIYGACYTFNNQLPPQFKSTRAGPLYGLRLLLNSDQEEYLPITESAGVRVSVHGQGEEPFPDAFGYNAAAGFTTSFAIKYIRTNRLPQPYGNCTNDVDKSAYYYSGNYSVEGCFRSCFQNHIKDACSCYDPRFGTPKGASDFCQGGKGHDDITCVSKFSSPQGESSKFNAISSCSCPQPCNESTYGVTVSTAVWPSQVFEPPDDYCRQQNKTIGSTSCKNEYKANTMMIEVYYERMNYQLLSESEAYGIVNLISDMGGQLGLWMGISVITMVEFFSLLVLLVLYCMAKRKEPNFDNDYSDDESQKKDSWDKNVMSPAPPPYDEDDDVGDYPAPPAPK